MHLLIFLFLCFFLQINTSKIKGVNLGSYFVLEPYINPSLFYQFIGINEDIIGDSYRFCEYLGPVEANKQLIKHWDNWITFDKLNQLKNAGINTVRIPVADWMFISYDVYDIVENNTKCFSKSLLYLDKLFEYCNILNLHIILDIHALKDSQNGFDNSGKAMNYKSYLKNNILYFDHWNEKNANWLGNFNKSSKIYDSINFKNINYSLDVIKVLFRRYIKHKSFWGFEPINEPWEFTPLGHLKMYYKKVYDIYIDYLIKYNIHSTKVLILHDSFRPMNWTNAYFLEKNGIPKIKTYLDTHQYMAWGNPIPFQNYIEGAHLWKQPYTTFDIIVGEFSLATDNCIMWLNGFMDNLPGYPLKKCTYEECPYKNTNIKYIQKVNQGPFGTGSSQPTVDGRCPISIPIYLNNNISQTNNFKNSHETDIEKLYMQYLFQSLIQGYENNSSGWIFWNFDIESASYQWSFLKLLDKKYINKKLIFNNQKSNDNKDFYDNHNYSLGFLFIFIILICYFIYYKKLNHKSYENYTIIHNQYDNYGSINV